MPTQFESDAIMIYSFFNALSSTWQVDLIHFTAITKTTLILPILTTVFSWSRHHIPCDLHGQRQERGHDITRCLANAIL